MKAHTSQARQNQEPTSEEDDSEEKGFCLFGNNDQQDDFGELFSFSNQ